MSAFVGSAATSVPASSRHSVNYRPDVDGLRAIAILSVVLYHANVQAFGGGFVGVDIFFVISGFLVGGHVYQEVTTGRFSYAAFYTRRAKRIVPAFVCMVLLVSAAALLLLSPDELLAYAKSALTAVLGVSDVWFWHSTDYFAPDARLNVMLMTWSLGVEEQFYVFLPLGLWLLARIAGRYVAVALATLAMLSLVAFLIVSENDPGAAFYLLPFRLWELGAGTLIAIFLQSGRNIPTPAVKFLGWAGLGAMLGAIFGFDEASGNLGVPLAVGGAAASIVAQGSSANRRLLASGPMVAIGLVSYSWYLWHWPLMAFVRLAAVGEPAVAALLVMSVLSLLIAILSWRYVEQPFRHPLRGKAQRSILLRYCGTLAITTVVPLTLYGCAGLPSRIGGDAAQISDAIKQPQENPCQAAPGDTPMNFSGRCVTSNYKRVALIGDSHAAMLSDSLRVIAAHRGYGIEVFAKSSCPTLLGLTHHFPRWPAHADQCAKRNAKVLDRVANSRNIRTVFLAAAWAAPLLSSNPNDRYRIIKDDGRVGRPASARDFERALSATVGFLTSRGKRVVILDDTPAWLFDPARQFYTSRLPVRQKLQQIVQPDFSNRAGLVDQKRWVSDVAVASVRVMRGAQAGATYIPLKDAFCDGKVCRFSSAQGVLYFLDAQHLTTAGADIAIKRFKREIDEDADLWR